MPVQSSLAPAAAKRWHWNSPVAGALWCALTSIWTPRNKPPAKSADKVARMALDGLDNKQLYVMPQVDARMIWRIKRLLPNSYAAITGLINRRMTSKFV
jgi:hypothetical protein